MNVGLNNMLSEKRDKLAAVITVLISLCVITPLCGFLFSCGCTWPGAGLEENCNYFRAAQHQCPWCTSIIAGGLSVGLAVLAGYFTAKADWFFLQLSSPVLNQMLVRVGTGLGVFLLVAFVTGMVSAKIQGYPTFLFGM